MVLRWTPALLLLLQGCVTAGGGQEIWSDQSTQVELEKRPSGFLPAGGQPIKFSVKREDLSAQALARLKAIRTLPLDSVPCQEETSWVRTLRIVDQQGTSRLYYTADHACPRKENRQIIPSESFEELERLL